jgi:hypothetical protein
MTKNDFSTIYKEDFLDLIINYVLCISVIIISLYFLINFLSVNTFKVSNENILVIVFVIVVSLGLISLGFYGLIILINPLKVSFLENENSHSENIELVNQLYFDLKANNLLLKANLIQFTYKKTFWSYSQTVFCLVDDNLLGLYVKTDSGPKKAFLDFGASSRTQKQLLELLANKFC